MLPITVGDKLGADKSPTLPGSAKKPETLQIRKGSYMASTWAQTPAYVSRQQAAEQILKIGVRRESSLDLGAVCSLDPPLLLLPSAAPVEAAAHRRQPLSEFVARHSRIHTRPGEATATATGITAVSSRPCLRTLDPEQACARYTPRDAPLEYIPYDLA